MHFSGSLRTLLQRESDRRRYVDSPYAWLFQPYMGDEQVALACHASAGRHPIVSVSAVVLDRHQVKVSRAWVATIANSRVDTATLRRHQRLYGTALSLSPDAENLATLVEFIGNRPLLGWQIGRSFDQLNMLVKQALGFSFPNARVDISKLYHRYLRRLCSQASLCGHLSEALERWQLPYRGGHDVLSESVASALLYIRLQRESTHMV